MDEALSEPTDLRQKRAPRNATVSATVAILRLLASERRSIGVNAIARQLKLTPSSCFNILKILENEGFVIFEPTDKVYSLGGEVVDLARGALDPAGAFDLVRQRAEDLSDGWELTVGLWRVQRRRLMLVGYVAGAKTMQIHLKVGERLPLLIGSIGRCVAARLQLEQEELWQAIQVLRWQHMPVRDDYIQDVEVTRRRGWALDRGNFIRGVATLSVPVNGLNGSILYALSATMFDGQHSDDRLDQLGQEMLEIAGWISTRLISF